MGSRGVLPPLPSDLRVGGGGFSDVYRDPAHQGRLIKVFKQPLVGNEAERFLRLIELDDWARPSDARTFRTRFAWPIDWWGEANQVTGFSMRMAPSGCFFSLTVAKRTGRVLLQLKYLENSEWWDRRAVTSEPPALTPIDRRELAVDWLDTIRTLHLYGLAYGDISSNNVCARLDDRPGVFLLDADSIGYPAEIEASHVHTVDWVTPENLDALERDRSLSALLVWRLFAEARAGIPTATAGPLETAGAGDLAPVLEEAYRTGRAEALDEVGNGLRLLRNEATATAALEEALEAGYARHIHREAVHGRGTRFVEAREAAEQRITVEDEIDEAPRRQRRRLLSRAALAFPGYALDLRPDHEGSRPTSAGQLRDRILDAEFEELARQLMRQGLGGLEMDRWLPRAIQHALVKAVQPEIEVSTSPGCVQVQWRWPDAEYANAAVVDVTTAERHIARETVARRPGQSHGRVEIQSMAELAGHVSLRVATQSRAGRVFVGSETSTSAFRLPVAQRSRHSPAMPQPVATAGALAVTVHDPVQVAETRRKEAETRRKEAERTRQRRLRRLGQVSISVCLLITTGVFVWNYLLPLVGAPPTHDLVFASDRDGDWEIYSRDRSTGRVTQLTSNSHDDRNPVWHPNGDFIAFESTYDGDWEILRMNRDGSDVRSFTFNGANDLQPAW